MSALLAKTYDLTPEQLTLIKDTVAKGATMDELKLFLYRCQKMNLDPLKPGLIHFVKFGSSPGTIVTGRGGLRSIAHRTGKLAGIRNGLITDGDKLLGAWSEVKRKDWEDVARAEVFMEEYDTRKGPWMKMPKTMIMKCAECAALRMAFTEETEGIYGEEEMLQAKRGNPDHRMAENEAKAVAAAQWENDDFAKGKRTLKEVSALASPGDFVITFGNLKGVSLNQCSAEELTKWSEDLINEAVARGQEIKPDGKAAEHLNNIEAYLKELEEHA